MKRRNVAAEPELSGTSVASNGAVRPDLATLCESRRVAATGGGVLAAPRPNLYEIKPGIGRPRTTLDAQLAVLVGHVAYRVRPGNSLAVTGGPASELLLRRLTRVRDLTFVTNSPALSSLAVSCRGPSWTVVLTGGKQNDYGALTGQLARQSIASLHFDLAVIDDVPRLRRWHAEWRPDEVEVATALAGAAKTALVVCLRPNRSRLVAVLGATVEVVSGGGYRH